MLLLNLAAGNLDSKTTEDISSLLIQLNAEYSVAIVLVTHDAQVAQAATTTRRMIDGQLR